MACLVSLSLGKQRVNEARRQSFMHKVSVWVAVSDATEGHGRAVRRARFIGHPRMTTTKAGEKAHYICVGSANGRLKERALISVPT